MNEIDGRSIEQGHVVGADVLGVNFKAFPIETFLRTYSSFSHFVH